MAKTTLPTDFQDDVLNSSMNGKRRYNEVTNDDGTFSLEDVTAYDTVGSDFGASTVNEMNRNINESLDAGKIISDMDTLDATAVSGYVPDALLVKEINDSLGGLQFGVDEDGNYGYIKAGADTVTPFSSSELEELNSLTPTTLVDRTDAPTTNYTYSGTDYKYICAVGGYRSYYGGTKVTGISGTYDKAMYFDGYSGCAIVKLKETDSVTIITKVASNAGCLNIIGYN